MVGVIELNDLFQLSGWSAQYVCGVMISSSPHSVVSSMLTYTSWKTSDLF